MGQEIKQYPSARDKTAKGRLLILVPYAGVNLIRFNGIWHSQSQPKYIKNDG
ncbi:MAG: hypothetical protein ACI9ES_002757 [Oceanospirillaceae bacterium]|jgi:hypothetical protein